VATVLSVYGQVFALDLFKNGGRNVNNLDVRTNCIRHRAQASGEPPDREPQRLTGMGITSAKRRKRPAVTQVGLAVEHFGSASSAQNYVIIFAR
jgi:hypothetical protein